VRPGPSGFGSIASVEFAVTLRAFEEYLPSAPATVLDIGGGPGRYAIELARRGYHLTLADISTGELALAAEKTAEAGARLEDVVQADARELNGFADDAFDAVLLMGPLYHLLEDADRRRAVDEAVRVARPGGMLFATNITRYAALRFWAKREPMRVVEDRLRYEAQIATGKMPDAVGFTDIYLMRPAELAALFEGVGAAHIVTVACEGIVSMIRERPNELEGEPWDYWVDLNYRSLHARAGRAPHVGGP